MQLRTMYHSTLYLPAYTKLHEHWIAKLGLPNFLVKVNGTEFSNNDNTKLLTDLNLFQLEYKSQTTTTFGL